MSPPKIYVLWDPARPLFIAARRIFVTIAIEGWGMEIGKKIFTAMVLMTLAACAPSGPGAQGTAENAQVGAGIIGGQEVPANSPVLRHIVGLYDTARGSICTGTLISNQAVLTAAHCIARNPRTMIVIFSPVLSKAPREQTRPVTGAAISSLRNQNRAPENQGDIAVVRFQGDIPTNYKPLPILPYTHGRILRPGTLTLLAGYGVSNGVNNTGSGTLRMVSVRIAQGQFSLTEILVDQTKGFGACRGDSGGPAIVFLGGQAYVWGVTSRGVNDPNNDCSQYGAYTNASIFADWIRQSAEQLNLAAGGR